MSEPPQEILTTYLVTHDTSPAELYRQVSGPMNEPIARMTFYNWLNGKNVPNLRTLKRLMRAHPEGPIYDLLLALWDASDDFYRTPGRRKPEPASAEEPNDEKTQA